MAGGTAIVFCFLAVFAGHALAAPALFWNVPFTNKAPTVNGAVSAGEYAFSYATDFVSGTDNPGIFTTSVHTTARTTATTSDFSFTTYMTYTTTTLHIAVSVLDNFIDANVSDAAEPYKNDAVEVFFIYFLINCCFTWIAHTLSHGAALF